MGPTNRHLFKRPLYWVVQAGYAGFYGPNRDALGFTTIAQVGAGVEVPFATNGNNSPRVRLSAGYLFGPGVYAWSLGIGLQR